MSRFKLTPMTNATPLQTIVEWVQEVFFIACDYRDFLLLLTNNRVAVRL